MEARFQPPPIAWRSVPSGAVQPMRAFDAVQRPRMDRPAPAGDELVGCTGGLFQLRRHDNPVLTRPSGVYNFVRVQGATRNRAATFMSAGAPHASLAAGRPVLYAGTAAFDGGNLQWWSNYSGTYQPQAAFCRQAALPEDKFVPWQQLQMGGIGLQRGMQTDRRRIEPPTNRQTKTPAAESSNEKRSAVRTALADLCHQEKNPTQKRTDA